MQLQLYLTPGPIDRVKFEGRTVVVIDVLRSSTSICAILLADAKGVIPTSGPGEAGEMWAKLGADNAVLAGERDGHKIENFQYGNSPEEFTPETVGGKYVIMSSTNGTGIFGRALKAELVMSGALVNISQVSAAVAQEQRDTVIICAGREGGFSVEDTLCAGMLIDLLNNQHACGASLNDAASLSLLLYDRTRSSLREAIAQGEHGRYLTSLGFARDILIGTEVNAMPVLPILRDGRLVKSNSLTPG